ncbi:hypothetical protein KAI87_06265 [Myxococcota bacterium]|nr:hypothetical protein [Myxococcota bacterium]
MSDLSVADSWPIVVLGFNVSPPNMEDLHRFITQADALLARKKPYTSILDLRNISAITPLSVLAGLSRWISTNSEALSLYNLGHISLANSHWAEAGLRMMYYLNRPPSPHTSSQNVDESLQWCVKRLRTVDVYSDEEIRTSLKAARLLMREPFASGKKAPKEKRDTPPREIMDAMDEPAYLVTTSGELVFSNLSALLSERSAPADLGACIRGEISDEESAPEDLDPSSFPYRLSAVRDSGRDLILAIPSVTNIDPPEMRKGGFSHLPPRLALVATHLGAGMSDKEIALVMDIPLSTARTYVRRIYTRLEVGSRAQFMRWWQKNGRWVKPKREA